MWYGVISGRAFLHCKKGTKADLNTVARDPRRMFKPQAPQGQEGTDGAVAEKRPPKKAERGKEEPRRGRRCGKEERQKADRIKRARGDTKGTTRPREPYTYTSGVPVRQITGTPE